jgi:hypothetical protein
MPTLATFAHTRSRESVGLFLLLLAVLSPFPLRSQDVDAGIDLWVTPQTARSAAISLTIPSDFFNSGSLGRAYTISLVGKPLPTRQGTPSLSRADTVVERLETARLASCGPAVSDTVSLRIAALRLQGRKPVAVTYVGSTQAELWDVQACLSSAQQEMGSLTIHRQCEEGGTFESTLPVRPKLVFKRRGDGLLRVLDWAVYPNVIKDIRFSAIGGWVYNAPTGFPRITAPAGAVTDGDCDGNWDPALPGTTENFVVGLAPRSCSCGSSSLPPPIGIGRVRHTAPDHWHPVDPASEDTTAFPHTRDRQPDRPDGKLQVFVPTLGLGVMLAALFTWRRRRSGPD